MNLEDVARRAGVSISIPRADTGHMAFQALVPSEEESNSHGREFRINPELVIRETTGPATSDH